MFPMQAKEIARLKQELANAASPQRAGGATKPTKKAKGQCVGSNEPMKVCSWLNQGHHHSSVTN